MAKSEVQRARERARELVKYPDDVSEDANAILVGLVYLAQTLSGPINRLGEILDEFLTEDEDIDEDDIPF